MASRDYYTPSYPPSYNAATTRREDATLPSLPSSSNPSYNNSSNRLPGSYPYTHPQHSDTSYTSSPYYGNGDPREDDGAVPLRPYNTKRDSQNSLAPIIQQRYDDDPFVRDAKPGKKRNYMQTPPPAAAVEQGWFKGKITWCCYFFSLVQIAVFIAELVRNGTLTGSPIEIKPSFNPMIGPSPYVLINMGARYQPCMHKMPNVNNTISWPCPSTTTNNASATTCTLAQLCGFNGLNIPEIYGLPNTAEPNQWFRFITPIFLHAGFIHIGFNLLLQLTLGRDMEIAIGSLRFALVYVSAGIFGFVLGGNFAANGIASTGASGSLFGVLALNLLDLLYHWQTRRSPMRDLIFILIDVGISFVLGLLPGLDNFSHIGGFLMGLVLGLCLLRSPPALSRRLGEDDPSYGLMAPAAAGPAANVGERGGAAGFARRPLGFFKGRKPLWWAWWLVRVATLIGTIIGFIVLLKNFYVWHRTCSWCKHLTCINVSNWCDIGNLNISTNPAKRAVDVLLKRAVE
ncbi:rhomboid-domain-containing protein [Myriangium duriaei CBS 260.36]|uniref:Rhomboid-type serine protease n=1 Tax=Myriangium duriaei CBS 260.36 TaxID=1168546 RepID=A0A9P4JBZ5_9PEZI|nr:rhomboid-domain-containing protein [Myriangium duriaei CBS 260.36]